ncbi:hypothetical protein Tco_0618106 [Tanacetum coccineum]
MPIVGSRNTSLHIIKLEIGTRNEKECLIDLLIGGRYYTWMNKVGTKLSKLDRFLIFEGISEVIPDIRVTAIDHMSLDHTPILLHVMKSDFGPTLFKFYNSWLNRDGFDGLIKSKWSTLEAPNDGRIIRNNDCTLKQVALSDIKDIEKKIDDGSDIEGDENSKFCYGMINNKRRSQANTEILHDGVWISDPLLIKEAFLNYYKDKFQAHDSQVVCSPMIHSTSLTSLDRDSLETHISLDKIKTVVWVCGSNKAPGPDGFSFAFIKKYWDIIKTDIFEFVNSFFVSDSIPQVLANRLSKVIDKVVSKEQSAFISGSQVLEGPLIIILLPNSLLNVVYGKEIPYLLFLFILAMEGLHGDISNAVNSGLIQGIKLGSSDITLSHLFYADDVGGSQDAKSLAWVKWSNLLPSFKKGVLNVCSLKAFSLALRQKWRWRLFSSLNVHWVKVIKALHCQEGGLDHQGCNFNGTWSRIVGSSNFLHSKDIILLNSFRFKVGCDTRIRLWKDIWIGDSPLHIRYNRRYRLEQDKDCFIIDRIVDLNSEDDTCICSMADDGVFSVRSIRRVIDSKLLPSMLPATTWEKTLPRKLKRSGRLFVSNVILLFLHLRLMMSGKIGFVRGMLLKRNLVIYMLSSQLHFGGCEDIVTSSLFMLNRCGKAICLIIFTLLLILGFLIGDA